MKITKIRRGYDDSQVEEVPSSFISRRGRVGTKGSEPFVHANLFEDPSSEQCAEVYVFKKDNSTEAWRRISEKPEGYIPLLKQLGTSPPGFQTSKERFLQLRDGELLANVGAFSDLSKNDQFSIVQKSEEIREAFSNLCSKGMDSNVVALTLEKIFFLKRLGRNKRRTLDRALASSMKAEKALGGIFNTPGSWFDFDVVARLQLVSDWLGELLHGWSTARNLGGRGCNPETPLIIGLTMYAQECTSGDSCLQELSVLTDCTEESLEILLRRTMQKNPQLRKGWRERLFGGRPPRRRARTSRPVLGTSSKGFGPV